MIIPGTSSRDSFRAAKVWALLCLLALLAISPPVRAETREVAIGVLALRGPERAVAMWTATADYLSQRLPEWTFRVVPLGFDEIHLAVRQRRVDFVLANPSFYVELETQYGVSPVVTMRNRHDGNIGFSKFGGVIFTRADHRAIRTVRDLKGKTFAAVDQGSFGGWHAAWRELLRQGINPRSEFANLIFAGTHDAVVRAVLDGTADAGTVRTETLERMAAEGTLRLQSLYVLNERFRDDFPLLHSTELYPEWPLAKIPGVSEALAVKVAVALMQMTVDDPAALASQTVGWTLPLNYQPVHDALRALQIGPYAELRQPSAAELLRLYGPWLAAGGLFVLFVFGTAVYVARINRRLRQQQADLRALNNGLERHVRERTDHIELLLHRERYLRGILATVADVNEILITTVSQGEMLKACCDRLAANADYRYAWTSLIEAGSLQVVAKSYGSAEIARNISRFIGDAPGAQAVQGNRVITVAGNDVSDELRAVGVTSICSLPLRKDAYSDPFGVLCVLTSRGEGFDGEELAMLEQLAGDIGFAVQAYRQRGETERLQQERIGNYEETILSLVDMIEKRDTYTAGHTRRVARYCELIARHLGLDALEIEQLKGAATLHDIGKIVIPDAVLLKPGSLTPLEYDLIKQHVMVGYETLSHIKMYRDLAEIMLHHHERHDGSGYPAGLAGERIPRLSRIMAVADAFDAMTTNRIYKPRMSVAQSLAELNSLAGRAFDPDIVAAALVALREVEPPSLADQLPKTLLERQRFAYFFNDHLTGLYNAEYLRFMVRNELQANFKHGWLILLRHFSEYNAAAGWAAGNALLAGFASHLVERFPEALACRVMGDDFLLLSAEPLVVDAESLRQGSLLRDTSVRVELRGVDPSARDQSGLPQFL